LIRKEKLVRIREEIKAAFQVLGQVQNTEAVIDEISFEETA
jgi:hypothetical protein